uniref:Uncharacterized protein n=1 Tax=Fagus sylvatica TaxID=28930 RepID=A0A2N9FZB5_FAGSY
MAELAAQSVEAMKVAVDRWWVCGLCGFVAVDSGVGCGLGCRSEKILGCCCGFRRGSVAVGWCCREVWLGK